MKDKSAHKTKSMLGSRENAAIISLIIIIQIAILIIISYVWFFLSVLLFVAFLVINLAGWWSSRKMGANAWKIALMEKFRMYTVAYVEYYDDTHKCGTECQDLEGWEKHHVIQAQYFMNVQEAAVETGYELSDIQEQVWRGYRPNESYYFRHARIKEVLPWWIPYHVIPYFAITILLSIPAIILGYLIFILHDNYNSGENEREIGLNHTIIESRKSPIVPVSANDLSEYIVSPTNDSYGP